MNERRKPGDAAGGFHLDFGAARESARIILDGTVYWRVYELPPSPYDRRRGGSLVFEYELGLRRVREYPPNWRDLSDEELLAYADRR